MKKTLAFFLCALMLLPLVSCNNGKNPDDSGTSEPVTVESEIDATDSTKDENDVTESISTDADTSSKESETDMTENTTNTESTSVEETDSETVTTEAVTTEAITTEAVTEEIAEAVSPKEGATVILANDEVYGWWDEYYYKKTGYSDAFYRHEDIFYPKAVTFSWEDSGNADYYRLFISTDKDFALNKTESYLLNAKSLTLDHLYVGTEYYWQVIATQTVDGSEHNWRIVPVTSFKTADSPRCLNIEGVSNTRDIGGILAGTDMRIKQGMIYRGGKLEKITDAGKEMFLDYLGLKTDLDLRTPGEGGAGSGSPLGADVNYINFDGRYYTGGKGITTEEGKKIFAEEIRVFADPDNYPIYIHCSLGRDRTGTLVMVLEGLLGVNKNMLFMDYELSVFSYTGTQDNASVEAIRSNLTNTYNYINNNYEGNNFAERTENYLLSIGITPEEIQTIRDLLLEEVK